MTRRPRYGERMAEWEAEKDERNWKSSLDAAMNQKDYERIEELVIEGIMSEYDFPQITDERVLEIIKSHKH